MNEITKEEGQFQLTVEEGKKYLRTAQIRVEIVPATETPYRFPAYTQPQILYEGEWVSLCRTDLNDDVATGLCEHLDAEQWRAHYLSHIVYGVRTRTLGGNWVKIAQDGTEEKILCEPHTIFACIDAFSDG